MMTLYSGTTDPFSQRCRIVLHEKGWTFRSSTSTSTTSPRISR
jgi:glutathione S-transferase